MDGMTWLRSPKARVRERSWTWGSPSRTEHCNVGSGCNSRILWLRKGSLQVLPYLWSQWEQQVSRIHILMFSLSSASVQLTGKGMACPQLDQMCSWFLHLPFWFLLSCGYIINSALQNWLFFLLLPEIPISNDFSISRAGQTVMGCMWIREITQDWSRVAWPQHCHQHNNHSNFKGVPKDAWTILS